MRKFDSFVKVKQYLIQLFYTQLYGINVGWFNFIPTLAGYSMSNPIYIYVYVYELLVNSLAGNLIFERVVKANLLAHI